MVAIILAAGESKRFGSNKLIFPINGVPILQRTISHVKQCHFQKIIVVYREHGIKTIVLRNNCIPLFCPEAENGQSHSIRKAVSEAGIFDGYCFFVGDNPLVDPKFVQKMQAMFYETNTIVVPDFNGKSGNPVIFPFRYRRKLMSLLGDSGGKKILSDHINDISKIQAPSTVLFDIDTTEDLLKL